MALIPVPQSPLVDVKNGTIKREWYLFLIEVFETLGSGNGGTTTQVLHGNNAGFSSVGAVDVTPQASGVLIVGQGVTLPTAFKAMSGDATFVSSGAITVTKTNGVALTTNATAPVGQLPGTTTNDNAAAGKVGEYLSSVINSAGQIALVSGTAADVTSVNLTAGDWDVTGVVDFAVIGVTSTDFEAGSSPTSGTIGNPQDSSCNVPLILAAVTDTYGASIPVVRYSLAGPASIFLEAKAIFTVGSVGAYGTIRARRVR